YSHFLNLFPRNQPGPGRPRNRQLVRPDPGSTARVLGYVLPGSDVVSISPSRCPPAVSFRPVEGEDSIMPVEPSPHRGVDIDEGIIVGRGKLPASLRIRRHLVPRATDEVLCPPQCADQPQSRLRCILGQVAQDIDVVLIRLDVCIPLLEEVLIVLPDRAVAILLSRVLIKEVEVTSDVHSH